MLESLENASASQLWQRIEGVFEFRTLDYFFRVSFKIYRSKSMMIRHYFGPGDSALHTK